MTNTIDSKSMSKPHAIQVPQEFAQELWRKFNTRNDGLLVDSWRDVLNCAAQWGWDQREPEIQERADHMLDACSFEIIDGVGRLFIDETKLREHLADHLRTAMRPKPPTLAEQALRAAYIELVPEGKHGSLIISALTRLAELEAQQ
jgi:hypothetical protein